MSYYYIMNMTDPRKPIICKNIDAKVNLYRWPNYALSKCHAILKIKPCDISDGGSS